MCLCSDPRFILGLSKGDGRLCSARTDYLIAILNGLSQSSVGPHKSYEKNDLGDAGQWRGGRHGEIWHLIQHPLNHGQNSEGLTNQGPLGWMDKQRERQPGNIVVDKQRVAPFINVNNRHDRVTSLCNLQHRLTGISTDRHYRQQGIKDCSVGRRWCVSSACHWVRAGDTFQLP